MKTIALVATIATVINLAISNPTEINFYEPEPVWEQRQCVCYPVISEKAPEKTTPEVEYVELCVLTSEPVYTEPCGQSYCQSTESCPYTDAKSIIAWKESRNNYDAVNPSGKYIGMYQLDADYLNGDYSIENQEAVADQYVADRYGSWDAALDFHNANGWY